MWFFANLFWWWSSTSWNSSFEIWEQKLALIIEDEKLLSEMYKIKLELNNFTVEVRMDWESWLEAIKKLKPDVVLLDLMMPKMNWLEVLDITRNDLWLDTKIIVFSNAPEKKDEALEKWADKFLVKADTTPNEVLKIIKQMV